MKVSEIPEYDFHLDEYLSKLIILNHEIIEEFQNYIKAIDSIDLGDDETLISIKIFTIAYTDFYSEIIRLIELKSSTGIEFYARSMIELTMYIRGLTICNDFITYLKADNYKQLKAIRNDMLNKKLLEPNIVKKEIETLKARIDEYSELYINGATITLNTSIESLFKIFECETLYTNHYRYFSRKVHVNIFEIQSKYKISTGLVFKPKLLIDDFMLSQLSIIECNQYMISSLRKSLSNLTNEEQIDDKNNRVVILTRDLIKKYKTTFN